MEEFEPLEDKRIEFRVLKKFEEGSSEVFIFASNLEDDIFDCFYCKICYK